MGISTLLPIEAEPQEIAPIEEKPQQIQSLISQEHLPPAPIYDEGPEKQTPEKRQINSPELVLALNEVDKRIDPFKDFPARRIANGQIAVDMPVSNTDTIYFSANYNPGKMNQLGVELEEPNVSIESRRVRRTEKMEDGMKLSQNVLIDRFSILVPREGKPQTFNLRPEKADQARAAIEAIKSGSERLQLLEHFSQQLKDPKEVQVLRQRLHTFDDFNPSRDQKFEDPSVALPEDEWRKRGEKLQNINRYLMTR